MTEICNNKTNYIAYLMDKAIPTFEAYGCCYFLCDFESSKLLFQTLPSLYAKHLSSEYECVYIMFKGEII